MGRKKSIQELYPNLNPKYIAPEDLKYAHKNRNTKPLKPCPFCASENLDEREKSLEDCHGPGRLPKWIICLGCFAEGPSAYPPDHKKRWNERRRKCKK